MKKSKKSKATTRGVKASKVSSKAAGRSSKSGVKKKAGGRVKKSHGGLTAARGLGVDAKPWAKELKGLEEPPITFKALKSVRDELLHHSMTFEFEVRGEFSKVRGEIEVDKGEMRSEFAALRGEMRSEFANVRGEMRFEAAKLRGEIEGVRGEMRSEFANVRGEISVLTKSMNEVLACVQRIQVEQEEVNQRSNAALDAFLLMRKEADVNSKQLEEKTNHRLNVVEIAVKDLYRRDKPVSIE